MENRYEDEFLNEAENESEHARSDEFKKLRTALRLLCFYEDEIFACPVGKENGCCPSRRVSDGVGEEIEEGKMGKIGEQCEEKREDQPVNDGRSSSDKEINDLLSVFRQSERP